MLKLLLKFLLPNLLLKLFINTYKIINKFLLVNIY